MNVFTELRYCRSSQPPPTHSHVYLLQIISIYNHSLFSSMLCNHTYLLCHNDMLCHYIVLLIIILYIHYYSGIIYFSGKRFEPLSDKKVVASCIVTMTLLSHLFCYWVDIKLVWYYWELILCLILYKVIKGIWFNNFEVCL